MTADPRRDDELEEYEAWVAGPDGPKLPGEGYRGRMRPSRLLALGLALVTFNLYLGRVDVLPNPLGWLLVVLALRQLAHQHRLLTAAMWCSVIGLANSVVTTLVSWTNSQVGLVPLAMVEGLLAVLVVVLVCSAVIALGGGRDASAVRQASILRWVAPVLALALVILAGLGSGSSGLSVIESTSGVAVAVLGFGVAGLAVHLWFLILLMTHGEVLDAEAAHEEPGIAPSGTAQPARGARRTL